MINADNILVFDEPESLGLSVRALANWILDYAEKRERAVTNMVLNKLVYFIYERYLVEFNVKITNAKIEAWDHGPVFREIYHSFKKFKDQQIFGRSEFFSIKSGKVEVVRQQFDAETENFFQAVLEPLLPLSASKLRALSHEPGGAWHGVWMHEGHANPGMEITPEIILETTLRKEILQ